MPGVIAYETWSDFSEILAECGVDVEAVPEERRAEVVASYPYGPFDDDAADADLEWGKTGGPWFSHMAEQLRAEGFSFEEAQ